MKNFIGFTIWIAVGLGTELFESSLGLFGGAIAGFLICTSFWCLLDELEVINQF